MTIYRIYNIKDGKSYVGWTLCYMDRIKRHLRLLRKKTHHSIKLQRAFNKYGEKNFKFEILYCKSINLKNILKKERYYIKILNSYNCGYNCTIGGEGILGNFDDNHWNSKPIYCYTINGFFFKKFNSTRGAARFFNKKKYENVASNINSCLNKKSTMYKKYTFKNKYVFFTKYYGLFTNNFHSVFQYDMEGNFIKSFFSQIEASKELKKINATNIISCINGIREMAYGFIWKNKFKSKINVKLKSKFWHQINKQSKKIIQKDKITNKKIRIFNSLADAGRFLNKRYENIIPCLKGRTKTAYGYKWNYV